ncbi:MAG: calcium/sodium antiporter [Acidimicrobiales bacterium]|nr:calcium/sodium antiporter [Acidimicrobiales bacterium]
MNPGSMLTFAAGVAVLILGAELLVRGATRIATRTGLSSVVIGLTVVAFGTSTPELAVSASAALDGNGDIAIGNVVGSNIVNVLLILGISAVIGGGLVVAQRIVRIDVPLMIGAALLVMGLSTGGVISRPEGLILAGLLLAYTVWTVRSARREDPAIVAEYDDAFDPDTLRRAPVVADVALVLVGLTALITGGRWLVSAASTIATDLGASDLIIGLTVVAAGTSMPELATSVIAALRGERDIAVGNVVGSNLFNLLGVLGVSAALAPQGLAVLDSARSFDLPVMTVVAVACLPVFVSGHLLTRWEGAVFVAYYLAYVTYLVLDAVDATSFEPFRIALVAFVAPLTVLTLVVVAVRGRRPVI